MLRPIALCLLVLGACSRSPAEPASTSSTTETASAPEAATSSAASSVDAGGLPLLWDDPPSFHRVPPKTPARAAEYVVSRVGADPEDAECVVMTFGPTQGGSVDDNVKRWVGQFHPALPTPRRTQIEFNGMKATFVEVTGTFAGNMMPNRQGFASVSDKPGWRMIGAILETPTGLWFFKLTGPDLTVRAGARAFETMVRSARPR